MRLVDLHCDWLRQYATEMTLYEGSLYPEVPGRVGRLDGYLLGTSVAVLVCGRKAEDRARQADTWRSLGLMIARYEAEFAGRILRDHEDVARWRASPRDGLCWGVLGVAGFDFLVREAGDLERLPPLFERGVRVFQPVAGREGVLAGSTEPEDERGLTDLGRAFLDRLAGLSRADANGPRPILDLAGMNARSIGDALHWLDEEPARRDNLPMALSHGTIDYREILDASSPASRTLAELRSRGVVIGVTPGRPGCETVEEWKTLVDRISSLPFQGRAGCEGVAIGSDLLEVDHLAPALSSARDLIRTLGRAFDRESAAAIGWGNAERILLHSAGA
jgi:membrane dipeptidase